MMEQIYWVLASLVGMVLVWLPWHDLGRIKVVATWTGIAIFSISWFWLPLTSQPRMSGLFGTMLSSGGIIFLAFGLALCVAATRRISAAVGLAGHGEPSRLILDGTYGFVRHPIYSGLFLAMLGWTLIWGGVYSMLLMPVLYLLFRLEARLEEKLTLERQFGTAYEAYRGEVPAFFPMVLAIPLLITALTILLGMLVGWIALGWLSAALFPFVMG